MTSRERKAKKFLSEANNIFMDASEYNEYELVGYCRLLEAIYDQTDEMLDENFRIVNIQEELATLDKRQYNILRLRYWDWHTFASIGTILSVSHQRIQEINNKLLYRLRRSIKKSKCLDGKISIEMLKLDLRGYRALKSMEINTIEQLMKLSQKDLLGIKGVGRITAEEIKHKLEIFMLEVTSGKQGFFEGLSIDVLEFTVRVNNALKRKGIVIIKQLFEMSTEELMSIKGIGAKGLNEILNKKQEAIAKYM